MLKGFWPIDGLIFLFFCWTCNSFWCDLPQSFSDFYLKKNLYTYIFILYIYKMHFAVENEMDFYFALADGKD